MLICKSSVEVYPVFRMGVMVSGIYSLDKKALIRFSEKNFIESGGTVEQLRKRLIRFHRIQDKNNIRI